MSTAQPERKQEEEPNLPEAAPFGKTSVVCSVTQTPVRETSSLVPLPPVKDYETKQHVQVVAEEAPPFNCSKAVHAFSSTDCENAMANKMECMSPSQILDEILKKTPTGRKVCQIGPNVITDSSIHDLNSKLSDEVIDAFLHMYMMPKKNVHHIVSVIMTAIFQGNFEFSGYLNEIQLHQYDELIGAVNEDQNHWVLIIIVPNAQCLVYMNPLGESQSKCAVYLNRWNAFLRARRDRDIDKDITTDEWEVHTVSHDKQSDGISCGVYVIKFARQYLSGEAMGKRWTQEDIEKERLRLQLELISVGVKAEPSMMRKLRSPKPKRKIPSSVNVKRKKFDGIRCCIL